MMMKGVVADLIRQNIANALTKSRLVGKIPHAGLQGGFREMLVESLLRPHLPPTCGLHSGTIVDRDGARFITKSPLGKTKVEDDVVIVDLEAIPPLFIDEQERGKSIIPVESVIARIEVKSTLNAVELRDALDGAMMFNSLGNALPKDALTDGAALRLLFAFDSDLAAGGKSEFVRLKEAVLAAHASMDIPPIMGLCVAGRGTWVHLDVDRSEAPDLPNSDGWNFCPPTPDHNEVLAFVGMIMNGVHRLRAKRVGARLGSYVVDLADFSEVK